MRASASSPNGLDESIGKLGIKLLGYPTHPRNLSQPITGDWTAAIKDQVERSVCRSVCRGGMRLEQGRGIFLEEPDWAKAYVRFFDLE